MEKWQNQHGRVEQSAHVQKNGKVGQTEKPGLPGCGIDSPLCIRNIIIHTDMFKTKKQKIREIENFIYHRGGLLNSQMNFNENKDEIMRLFNNLTKGYSWTVKKIISVAYDLGQHESLKNMDINEIYDYLKIGEFPCPIDLFVSAIYRDIKL